MTDLKKKFGKFVTFFIPFVLITNYFFPKCKINCEKNFNQDHFN